MWKSKIVELFFPDASLCAFCFLRVVFCFVSVQWNGSSTLSLYLFISAARWTAAADMLDDMVKPNFSCIEAMAAVTGVWDVVGAGVVVLVVGALRLCAMWLLTRWPAASALHRESSPASTPAATMRASLRALSPGFVG